MTLASQVTEKSIDRPEVDVADQSGMAHNHRDVAVLPDLIAIFHLNLTGSYVVANGLNTSSDQAHLYESFVPEDIFKGDFIEASDAMLKMSNLDRFFTPSDTHRICLVRISGLPLECSLACRLSRSQTRRDVEKQIKEHRNEFMPQLMSIATSILAYENVLASAALTRQLPCLATDSDSRIVIGNSQFWEMIGTHQESGVRYEDLFGIDQAIDLGRLRIGSNRIGLVSLEIRQAGCTIRSLLEIDVLPTAVGQRYIWSFPDAPISERSKQINYNLLQRLSELLTVQMSPDALLRKLINSIAVVFEANMVALFRHDGEKRLILTPYTNRMPQSLRIRFIDLDKEPYFEPYRSRRSAIFCSLISDETDRGSLIVSLGIKRFALVPVGRAKSADHVLLVGWSGEQEIDGRVVSALRVLANLIGAGLVTTRLIREFEKEKDTLERYAKLATDRELAMTKLKRENAKLRQVLRKLQDGGYD